MLKRFSVLLMALIFTFGATMVSAAGEITPFRASYYLDGYSVVLSAKGDGRMLVTMIVDGVGVQDKIGVAKIDIDEKVNGKWDYYDTLFAVDHPEFYEYDTRDYLGEVSFYGTPGNSYRVTLLVYAEKDGGWDTGDITSYTVECK